jgi:prephenate dehydratase
VEFRRRARFEFPDGSWWPEKGSMPAMTQSPLVGTLGGPATFAGQATQALTAKVPDLGRARFFPTMDEVWEAAATGTVDSVVLTGETTNTGLEAIAQRLLTSERELYVNAEILVPYHCMLLGKPGTTLDQVELVLGHGSLVHCQSFLARRLPQAKVRMHDLNSLAAAEEVLASDGDIAVVGTLQSAKTNGLAVLASDIDQGSVGSWWLLARELRVSGRPNVLVVRASSTVDGALPGLVRRLANDGIKLRGLAAVGAGAIFSYDYLAVLQGDVSAVSRSDVIGDLPGCRLLGAFESMSADGLGLIAG